MAEQTNDAAVLEGAEVVAKRALRRSAKAARDDLDTGYRRSASRRALLNLMAHLPLGADSIVAASWPCGSELDVRPLFDALAALGVATCLPRMAGKGRALTFLHYRPGDALLEGSMRVFEPLPTAAPVRPTVILVPLLAFDDAGYRLGYGGGFYDRTLPTLGRTAVAIGLAFESQHVPVLPREATDVRLEVIVTEAAVHRFR